MSKRWWRFGRVRARKWWVDSGSFVFSWLGIKNKEKVCEIGKGQKKKKSNCFVVCTNFCMQLWLAMLQTNLFFTKKEKNSCAASAEGGTLLVCKNSCVLRRCSPPAIANSGSSHVLTPCLYVRVKGQGFLSRWKLPKTIWLERKWPQYKAHNVLAFWPTHCPLLVCGCAVVMRKSCGWVTSYQGQE